MRILFLENQAVFAETVVSQFLGGHDVRVVTSIREARRAVDEFSFDVLLVDYDLDGEKGASFVSELRAQQSRIWIVAVSAHEDGNAALLAAGANATCPKGRFHEIGRVLELTELSNSPPEVSGQD